MRSGAGGRCSPLQERSGGLGAVGDGGVVWLSGGFLDWISS